MTTIKVIDLLNKIANGEEVPRKIKYDGQEWEYNPINDYEGKKYGGCLLNQITLDHLNDEIEIIEDTPKEEIQVLSRWYPPKEDKKIKRIQSCGDNLYSEYIGQWLVHKENYSEYDELLMNKINEIIDRLNGE